MARREAAGHSSMESCANNLPRSPQGLYYPLSPKEYRVVHLLPGKLTDDIQCKLEIRSTLIRSSYEAISYQWGDETITKPIRIARLQTSPTRALSFLDNLLPQRMIRHVSSPYRIFCDLYRDHSLLMGLALTFFIAYLFWRPLPVHYYELSPWEPLFISVEIYRICTCLAISGLFSFYVSDMFTIIQEIVDTKLWRIFGWRNPELVQASSEGLELIHVTSNLESALRHLRHEKRVRTLWIDALCINQHNQSEKLVQVQQMDWIFANAHSVLIWLGGYHDSPGRESCGENLDSCKHRDQIEATFAVVRAARWWMVTLLSHWLFPWTHDENFYQKADAGLLDIAKRGWWKRLWVIQEVALATGHVKIQCGYSTCSYDLFTPGSTLMLLQRHMENDKFLEECRPCIAFQDIINDFGYSLYAKENRGYVSKVLDKTLEELHLATSNASYEFVFARRLGIIMLRTSGRFGCRDDTDRLYAVLGIAGRALTGRKNKIANFVNLMGLVLTHMATKHYRSMFADSYYLRKGLKVEILSTVTALVAIICKTRTGHWTISRPDYVIGDSEHLMETVVGTPRDEPTRVDVFTKLAQYLANETGSLFFLDLASCGEDQDRVMPSWVPNWSRVLSESAFRYARTHYTTTLFSFVDGGKSFELTGKPVSIMKICSPKELDILLLCPGDHIWTRVAAKPGEFPQLVVPWLKKAQVKAGPGGSGQPNEHQLMELLACSGALEDLRSIAIELRRSGTTAVYCVSPVNNDSREIGYLRAGAVTTQDKLVMVPGCFHHIVLRPQQKAGKTNRWKLVGLVEMGMEDEWLDLSAKEWKQWEKSGKLCKYIIE